MAEHAVDPTLVNELEDLLETEHDDGAGDLIPEEIHQRLTKPFDKRTHKPKQGFTYIPQAVVRKRVINATRNHFSWEVLAKEFRDGAEIGLGGTIMVVTGRLTIPGLGCRDGIGTSVLRKGSEEQYKAAETDAFKRAAMAFGVALELYPGDMEPDLEAGQAPRPPAQSAPATKPTTKSGARTVSQAGANGSVTLDECKAGVTRAATKLGRDHVAGYMIKTFTKADGTPVETSSDLSETDWRRFYAWAAVEMSNAARAAA